MGSHEDRWIICQQDTARVDQSPPFCLLSLHFEDTEEFLCASFNILGLEPNYLAEEIVSIIGNRRLELFEYSAGFLPGSFLLCIPWAFLDCDRVSIEFAGMPADIKKRLIRILRKSNYYAVRGGNRETGTDILFTRNTTHMITLGSHLGSFRFKAGKLIVALRNRVTASHVWASRKDRLMRFFAPGVTESVIIDQSFGVVEPPFNPLESQAAALIVESGSITEWSVDVPQNADIERTARLCYDRHGVYPISFSFPERLNNPVTLSTFPSRKLSQVIPGHPYSFDNPTVYLHQYSDSHLAITHRKAGWDCFRHVEILASGSVPLMLDSSKIPEFSMIHYPKKAMEEVVERALTVGGIPDFDTRKKFNDYYRRHLTSESMVQYMFSMSGTESAKRILFVDTHLPSMVDYQSVLALIGLKQLFGKMCDVLCPVEYIYEGWAGNESELYGRGFGYTRVLPDTSRSEVDLSSHDTLPLQDPNSWGLEGYDALVFGNIYLDIDLAESVLRLFPPEKTMWILGSDRPPNWRETKRLVSSGANVFVRAINSKIR